MAKEQVTAAEVRAWARDRGFEVGQRGHLPQSVVEAYNRAHRVREFTNGNPWLGSNQETAAATA